MRESTRKHWERFWGERDLSERYPSVGDVIGELLSVVEKIEGERVLEVGAGSGRDSVKLAQKGARVFVLDYARTPLELVKKMVAREELGVGTVQADATRAPFLDGCFDIVFHQGLLEHFRDPHALLSENWRILRSGGSLLVDVPQRYHLLTLLKHVLMSFNAWFAGWETEFTIHQLVDLLEKEGFEVLHIYGNWMMPPLGYRLLREISLRSPLQKLPLYPRAFAHFSKAVSPIVDRLRKKKLFIYTCAVTGAVGRK